MKMVLEERVQVIEGKLKAMWQVPLVILILGMIIWIMFVFLIGLGEITESKGIEILREIYNI